MKKGIAVLMLLSLFLALLSAMDWDGARQSLGSKGDYGKVYGKTYWVANQRFAYPSDAVEYVVETAMVLLYAQAGWDAFAQDKYQKIAADSYGVAAYYAGWEAGEVHLLAQDLAGIIAFFEDEDFLMLERDEQMYDIWDYVMEHADFSANK